MPEQNSGLGSDGAASPPAEGAVFPLVEGARLLPAESAPPPPAEGAPPPPAEGAPLLPAEGAAFAEQPASTLPLPALAAPPHSAASSVRAAGRKRMPRTALVGIAVVFVALLVSLRSGAAGALLVLGLALLGGALVVLRGRAGAPAGRSRRSAGLVGALGLVALVAGAGVSIAPASSSTPVPRASGHASTSAVPLAAAPTTMAPAAPAATSEPPRPALALACPAAAAGAVTFTPSVTAAGPYTVAVDYGDGQSFRGDDRHLAQTFSHTYATPGTFRVAALLSDAAGGTATASCTYSWRAPAAVATRAPATVPSSPAAAASHTAESATGASGTAESSTGARSYTTVDGNRASASVTAVAPPAGASARCKDGTYSLSQHRQGTCSGHGGVAAWL